MEAKNISDIILMGEGYYVKLLFRPAYFKEWVKEWVENISQIA